MTTIKTLCNTTPKTSISSEYGAVETPEGWTPGTHSYKITLRRNRKQLTTEYHMGPACTDDPTASGVLSCLLSDASSVECSRHFEDWASDMGYDTDSRKAESMYRACESTGRKLRRFLGSDFNRFCMADQD